MLSNFQRFKSDMETVWNIWTEEYWVISVRQSFVGKHEPEKPAVSKTQETEGRKKWAMERKEQNDRKQMDK